MNHRGRRAASAARYSIVCACVAFLACAPADSGLSPEPDDAATSTSDAGASSGDGAAARSGLPLIPIVEAGIGDASDAGVLGTGDATDTGTGATSPCSQRNDGAPGEWVLTHHNDPGRRGAYVTPLLSRGAVATMHRDPCFDGSFIGVIHAQPLYVEDGPRGNGAFFVATESNDVIAFDETTGLPIWSTNLGPPADSECAACPNPTFTPIGITGTPVIDRASRTIYVDSVLGEGASGTRLTRAHLIHALSLDDGAERTGWPVDPTGIVSNGHAFVPGVQNQRGALAIAGGMLYVPYGSVGDCGDYNGWIIAVSMADPTQISAYATPGSHSGLWGSGGVASQGDDIWVATGNGNDAEWAGSEAVLRFPAGVPLPSTPIDFFAPFDWRDLDLSDSDIGSSGVTLFSLADSTPARLAMAFGKNGYAYLLDADALGGIADDAAGRTEALPILTHDIATAPAAYTTAGRSFVVVDGQTWGQGIGCPAGQSGDVVGLEITPGAPATMAVAFCTTNGGDGAPIVTTTDGDDEPIVWITSDASQRLHAFDGVTGALLFDGGGAGDVIAGAHRFNTVIAVHNRIIVAATSGLYAFTL